MFIHNDVEIKYKNEWKYRVLWHCFKGKFKHFDAFVAGTASIIEPFRRLSGVTDKPYSSIHNFIDVEAIRKKAEEPTEVTVDESCVNFVALGRLVHQKGYDIMLNYFGDACKTREDLRLYIIGDGEDREALEKQCEELGLKEAVRRAWPEGEGVLPRQPVQSLLHHAEDGRVHLHLALRRAPAEHHGRDGDRPSALLHEESGTVHRRPDWA